MPLLLSPKDALIGQQKNEGNNLKFHSLDPKITDAARLNTYDNENFLVHH